MQRFPQLSHLTDRLLLLPVSTASCERSLLSLNRVLCTKKSQLTGEHLSQLTFLTHEGPANPHLRNTDEDEWHHARFKSFVSNVYRQYMKHRHRT